MPKAIFHKPKAKVTDSDNRAVSAGKVMEDGGSLQAVGQISRAPVQHEVKSWPHIFEATISGAKKHDMRRLADRDYQVGDTMVLKEFDPDKDVYTGREVVVKITYVTSLDFPCALSEQGLHSDFCILSIALA